MRLTLSAAGVTLFELVLLEPEDDDDDDPAVEPGKSPDFVERRLGTDSALAEHGEVETPSYPVDRRSTIGFQAKGGR